MRRCIAGPGQWVDIDQDGNVYVDNILLEEPYLTEKALDSCDIELPWPCPGRLLLLFGRRTAHGGGIPGSSAVGLRG